MISGNTTSSGVVSSADSSVQGILETKDGGFFLVNEIVCSRSVDKRKAGRMHRVHQIPNCPIRSQMPAVIVDQN